MIMGIGRGDSARRYIGQQPVRVAEFEEALRMIKPFMNGKEVEWNGKELELKSVRPELPEIEMHVAGYGPKALAVAGRQGDGVGGQVQLADPDIIQWIMGAGPHGGRRGRARSGGRLGVDNSALTCVLWSWRARIAIHSTTTKRATIPNQASFIVAQILQLASGAFRA